MMDSQITEAAIDLLRALISTPSFSGEEGDTALLIEDFLKAAGHAPQRLHNNVWATSSNHAPGAPVLLLNSHHDTVRPAKDWQGDPFAPVQEGDKLTGLGSNDAGASAVALLASFVTLAQVPELPVKLIVAITAEEENSGPKGIASLLPQLGPIDAGIVGEPTGMEMAVAEKGLVVIDCTAHGKGGHAARDEGENALYKAVRDIQRIQDLHFEKVSDLLGPVKLSVTQIEAGSQHNVVPAACSFVIDVRTNEHYSNAVVVETLQDLFESEVKARSLRLNSSGIASDHPLVRAGAALGRGSYGSPTLSDQAQMPFNTLKMGPGASARSHTAGEYILLSEIKEAISLYTQLITSLPGDKKDYQ